MIVLFEGQLINKNFKFAVIVSRFNAFITNELLLGAIDGLHRHGINKDDIDIIYVPGAFEIPLIAKKLAKTNKYNAIITLGAVIRGSTTHYDYVCSNVASGIAHVALEYETPIIFGVLTTKNIEQAIERSGTKAGNKGYEAAVSAIEMANLSLIL